MLKSKVLAAVLAACVAVFCVCGALAGTVYLQHSGGKGNADTTAMMTAESADVAEESAELEVACGRCGQQPYGRSSK
jgi:hypothetical protein